MEYLKLIGRILMEIVTASSYHRARQIEQLYQKSDEELAKMNLRRDEIAAYVFRDLAYT